MLYFQVACAQKFQKREETIHSKYQRATPEVPVFFILRCMFKNA